MSRRVRPAAVLAAFAVLGGACGDGSPAGGVAPSGPGAGKSAPAAAPAPPVARPAPLTTHTGDGTPAPTREQIDAAMRRGVEFLVRSQRKDGSWGSTAPTLTVDIYAPGPDAQRAYRGATTGLAVSALIECGAGVPGADEAVRRGIDFLVANAKVRRASIDVLYNMWAHAYALEAFARVLPREKDEARRAAIRKASDVCVDMLARFEYAEGGWGYYDFDTHTAKPGNMATSFGTATVLVALRMAADQGIEVPKRLTDRGVQVLGRMRFPNGAFAYSWDHRFHPTGGINKIKGSLARTPACYDALRGWSGAAGAGKVTDEQIAAAFENLRKEGRFLQLARKYPYPHETWYQNSGYFTFYGYYHAGRLLGALAPDRRAVEAASIASYLVPLQEEDGSWWDYQLYGYHKPYGTAYVLMTLANCRGS